MVVDFDKDMGNVAFRCVRCGNLIVGYREKDAEKLNAAVKKLNHVLTKFQWIATSLVFVFVVQLLVWLFDREPPFIYRDNSKVTIVSDRVVSLRYNVFRVRACDVDVTRYLETSNGRSYLSPLFLSKAQIEKLAKDSPGIVELLLEIPVGVSMKSVTYSVELAYTCNPLHHYWPIKVHFSVPLISEPV